MLSFSFSFSLSPDRQSPPPRPGQSSWVSISGRNNVNHVSNINPTTSREGRGLLGVSGSGPAGAPSFTTTSNGSSQGGRHPLGQVGGGASVMGQTLPSPNGGPNNPAHHLVPSQGGPQSIAGPPLFLTASAASTVHTNNNNNHNGDGNSHSTNHNRHSQLQNASNLFQINPNQGHYQSGIQASPSHKVRPTLRAVLSMSMCNLYIRGTISP